MITKSHGIENINKEMKMVTNEKGISKLKKKTKMKNSEIGQIVDLNWWKKESPNLSIN